MRKEKEEIYTIFIVLDNGTQVKCEYDDLIFDELTEELTKSMESGCIFAMDGSYDVSMYDFAGNYLSALNGKRIIGYSY